MKVESLLIMGALGGLAYLYLEEESKTNADAENAATCGPLARLKVAEDGQKFCEPKLKCKEGFVLSQDMTQCFDKDNPCGPGFRMDAEGSCQITDEACGDRCYKLNDAKDNCIKIAGCGTATGSEIGDVFLYLGESIVLGVIYDWAGRKVMKVAERKLVQEATRKAAVEAAKEAAQKATTQAAKGASSGATKLATQIASQRLAGRAADVAVKRSAIAIATKAAKKVAQKIAIQLAKIASLSSTGIGVLATPLMILSTSLSIGMTAAGVFFEVPPGYTGVWEFDQVPEAAQVALTSLPVIGDVLDMVLPYIFFTNGCAPGLENQNELCYEPPHKDFQCEAFLCPVIPDKMPGYQAGNFLGATKFHLTKRIITDTGTIPNTCRPGFQHGAEGQGFCYEKQAEPGTILLGTWWESCPAGFRDDVAFCTKEHLDPCPDGSTSIAGTCWGTVRVDYLDDCSKGWDDCKHKSWNAAHCNSWGCRQCTSFGLLGESCITNHACCNSWGNWHCTGGCKSSPHNVQGITKELKDRNLRIETIAKKSRVLAPHGNICVPPRSEDIAGLCYPNQSEMPPGYHRKVIGTLDPGCPGDKDEWRSLPMFNPTQDVGVSCQLGTYTRPPFPKIGLFPKRRVVIEDPPDPPLPPYCGDLPTLPATDPQFEQRLCRESQPPSGYELSADGLSFYRKCRDLFNYNFTTTNCEMIKDDGETEKYANAEGLLRVDYDFK